MDLSTAVEARIREVSGASVVGAGSLEVVIERMRELDQLLPSNDGLKWFNWLYLQVTEAVARQPGSGWSDPPWLLRLDLEFAQLYFDAVALWMSDRARCPRAWVPVFERRGNRNIAPLQFALAGMNAHINRDLAVAVVRTGEALAAPPRRGSAQHADFRRVNDLLEAVQGPAIEHLSTGVIGELTQLGPLDDIVAMWNVRKARDAAWTNAEVLWSLRPLPDLAAHYLDTIDRITGFAGRGLLLPIG